MQPIRVLVIDDSAFMRKVITDILENDQRVQVVGTARNGEDGINKIRELSPDVVTMDVNMPVLDGISALQDIMRTHPLPVIMLSSKVGDGTDSTIRAMEHGAVDFITKPSGEISLNMETIQAEIVSKVITAAKARIQPIPKETEAETHYTGNPRCPIRDSKRRDTMVFVGTSTGGPRALQQLLTDLPENFTYPILIVQHMPPGFTNTLAKRLNTLTRLHVKEAEHGEFIRANTAYIAPGDYHLMIEKIGLNYAIKLTKAKPINNHRPSVDALFDSAAMLEQVNKIGVVLTGMGSDGSKGIKAMKQADKQSLIITEAEETSIIYGMPKAAAETGVVDEVLPLHKIGHFLGRIKYK